MAYVALHSLAKFVDAGAKKFHFLDLLLLKLRVDLPMVLRAEFEENDIHQAAKLLSLSKRRQRVELAQVFVDGHHHFDLRLVDEARQ